MTGMAGQTGRNDRLGHQEIAKIAAFILNVE